jgi:potassium/hydrogen antiporter
VTDLVTFGQLILLVAAGLGLAIAVRVIAGKLALPTAALLLVGAAVSAELIEPLHSTLTFSDVQRIATVALLVILFEGGAQIGLERFRKSAAPIVVLGIVGTFGTAALLTVVAHVLLDLSWTISGLIGAALAPTDPAVTFSVLAGREVEGRSGTILEGESGFNDPVGIALMIGLVEFATADKGSLSTVVVEFVQEMAIGLTIGALGGLALVLALKHVRIPDRSLYPLAVIIGAAVIYGVAATSHGSGFLAVFVAGIVVGDLRFPEREEVRTFNSAVADLGELATFIALGLTIDLGFIFTEGLWWRGLVLAVILGFVIRPLVVAPLLMATSLNWGERGFIIWSGLKGAVPILLASLAVVGQTDYAPELYGIVFVVVLFSVLVQGTFVPAAATLLGVPMASRGKTP